MLEEQELDSSAANPQGQETETKTDSGKNGADSSEQLRWSDVYKEALTPVVDSTGIITIYLTQGKNAVYNDGKTAEAKTIDGYINPRQSVEVIGFENTVVIVRAVHHKQQESINQI